MKRVVFFTLMVFFVCAGAALPYNDGHSMITGIVNEISSSFIVIDNVKYVISPQCKVKIEYKVDNAFYLRPARLFDLRRGDSVNVVKIANTITEINIERWKQ